MKKEDRIEVIDGFRCIAIFAVMLYHFYSRYTQPISPVNYYPFHQDYAQYFNLGFWGVHFFFMISGFVIFYTLEKSNSSMDFFYKRYIRLFPAMFLCSVITWLFMEYVDYNREFPGHINTKISFLPSLTFTTHAIWNKLFNRHDISYISGSYWSLWPEVCFYLLAGLVYFFNKKDFVSNWVKILIAMTLLRIFSYLGNQHFFEDQPIINEVITFIRKRMEFFNVSIYIIYFTLGILFYTLYSKKPISRFNLLVIVFCSILEMILVPNVRIAFIPMIMLFILFIYKKNYLHFLSAKVFSRIGIISYTLYLIHENIGLVLINKFSGLTGSYFMISLLPLVVIVIFILFSEIVFRYYEKPLNKFLKNKAGKFKLVKKESSSLPVN